MKKIALTLMIILTTSATAQALEVVEGDLWCGNSGFDASSPTLALDICRTFEAQDAACQAVADSAAERESKIEELEKEVLRLKSSGERKEIQLENARLKIRKLRAKAKISGF